MTNEELIEYLYYLLDKIEEVYYEEVYRSIQDKVKKLKNN